MTAYVLEDDFGRVTRFQGELLVWDTTDTEDRRKPQWTETGIYRTEGGRYVVWSEVKYRIRHAAKNCRKLREHDLVDAAPEDTYPCNACDPEGRLHGRWGQDSHVRVDVCDTPVELIARLSTINQQTGLRTHSQYSQALLARLSDLDPAIREVWMEQVVL